MKLKTSSSRMTLVAAACILAAYLCRVLGLFGVYPRILGMLRTGIYLSVFTAWGISVRSRILQKQIRRYMSGIALLMVVWYWLRSLKFHFISSTAYPNLVRYIWYLYYLAILWIPLLAVLIALSIGKPEQERLPGWTVLFCIITALLFLLVMTNDWHQLVFTFPPEATVWSDMENGYGIGYYILAAWIAACTLLTMCMIAEKCRIPGSRRRILLPSIPLFGLVLYFLLYNLQFEWLRQIAGDMTSVICLAYALTLELCIQYRYIPSNTHYRELSAAAAMWIRITDSRYRVRLSSAAAGAVEKEMLKQAAQAPVMLSSGFRLSGKPIRGGYVFWQEDVSQLQSVVEALHDTKEELTEYVLLLEEENKQKQQRRKLEEKKRIYETMNRTVAPALQRMEQKISQLEQAEEAAEARKIHGQIMIIGAYVKRRSNLVLMAESGGNVPAMELLLCLNESAANLRLAGIACAVQSELAGIIEEKTAGRLYDFFETMVEAAWDEFLNLNVILLQNADQICMRIMLQCGADLQAALERLDGVEVEQDEDVWYCSLTVPERMGKDETAVS